MSNINGNIPSLKNSKLIGEAEIKNAKQNMNSAASKNMILGAKLTQNTSNAAGQGNMTSSVPSLNSTTYVGTEELQNVQINTINFVPSLNSSTSVGSKEMQNVKNEVQKSGNNKGLF